MKKTTLLLLVFISMLTLYSCDYNAPLRRKMIGYYTQDDVYVHLSGTVVSIEEQDDWTLVIIDILTENHGFSLNTATGYGEFVIISGNTLVVSLCVGDVIEFTSAPFYFYSGHRWPIVALRRNGEELLSFEQGRIDYLRWIRETFD